MSSFRKIFIVLPEVEATRQAYLRALARVAPEFGGDAVLQAEAEAVRNAILGIALLQAETEAVRDAIVGILAASSREAQP